MYLHEQAIKALIEYRKANGYSKTIHPTSYDNTQPLKFKGSANPCGHGKPCYPDICAEDIPF